VPVVPHLSPLPRGPALLQVAREHQVDLMALGASGHEVSEELEDGTAKEQVIDQTGCAILVAR
jgi:nucleotide-binding universal stress UspA family protein